MGDIANNVLTRVDSYTKEFITYEPITKWEKRTTITPSNEDTYIDNYIYIKYDGIYYKRVITDDIYSPEMFFNPETDLIGGIEIWDLPFKRLDDFAKGRGLSVRLKGRQYSFDNTLTIYSCLHIRGNHSGAKKTATSESATTLAFPIGMNRVVFAGEYNTNSYYQETTKVKNYRSEGFSIDRVAIGLRTSNGILRTGLIIALELEDQVCWSRGALRGFHVGDTIVVHNPNKVTPTGEYLTRWKATITEKITARQRVQVTDHSNFSVGDFIKSSSSKNKVFGQVVMVSREFNTLFIRELTTEQAGTIEGGNTYNNHRSGASDYSTLQLGAVIENLTQSKEDIVGTVSHWTGMSLYKFTDFQGTFSSNVNNVAILDGTWGNGITCVHRGHISNVTVQDVGNIGISIQTMNSSAGNVDYSTDLPIDPEEGTIYKVLLDDEFLDAGYYRYEGGTWVPHSILNPANNNLTRVSYVSIINAGTSGIHLSGADSNACNLHDINCTHITGYGIHDSAFLGTHVRGVHTSLCVSGPIYGGSSGSIYLGVYTEGQVDHTPFYNNRLKINGNAYLTGGHQGSYLTLTSARGTVGLSGTSGMKADTSQLFSRGNFMMTKTGSGNANSTGTVIRGNEYSYSNSILLTSKKNRINRGGSLGFGPDTDYIYNRYNDLYKVVGARVVYKWQHQPSLQIELSKVNNNDNKIVISYANKIGTSTESIPRILPYVDSSGNLELIIQSGGAFSKPPTITGTGEYEGLEAIGFLSPYGVMNRIVIITPPTLQGSLTPTTTNLEYAFDSDSFYPEDENDLGTITKYWKSLFTEKIEFVGKELPDGNIDGKKGTLYSYTPTTGDPVIYVKKTNTGNEDWYPLHEPLVIEYTPLANFNTGQIITMWNSANRNNKITNLNNKTVLIKDGGNNYTMTLLSSVNPLSVMFKTENTGVITVAGTGVSNEGDDFFGGVGGSTCLWEQMGTLNQITIRNRQES